jgi:SAM-dependent methyltransferase
MSFKNVIKKFLPARLNRMIGAQLVRQRERRLSQLSIQDAFDEVYKKAMWKQGDSTSGLGSEGELAERYLLFVLNYAKANNIHSIVDAGCGDFSVGSRLAPHFEKYVGLDVAPTIIEINKKRYVDLVAQGKVEFGVADLTASTFPPTDLILIRQVLQHLTNTQIEQILRNLEASKWRRALITEEVYEPESNSNPNVDLPSHTVRTRVALNSGVFIDREPFNRKANRVAIIREEQAQKDGVNVGLLVFELTRSDEI